MTRPYSIYVSRQVRDMLNARKVLTGAECTDEIAEHILYYALNEDPAIKEYLKLKQKHEAEFERKVTELVRQQHE